MERFGILVLRKMAIIMAKQLLLLEMMTSSMHHFWNIAAEQISSSSADDNNEMMDAVLLALPLSLWRVLSTLLFQFQRIWNVFFFSIDR